MRSRFEANVARETPKTKMREPKLPWELSTDDLSAIESKKEDYKSITDGTPPLRTRAVFLIALVIVIFGVTSHVVFNIVTENENARLEASRKETEKTVLQANLARMTVESEGLRQDSEKLETQVKDLSAQKELFTAVIENLTQKGDEI